MMKRLAFILAFVFLGMASFAQQTYTVNGASYELKTEISGTIDLLWNIIDGKYRYFAKKGTTIVELTNTKGDTKKYQEEYKNTLEELTPEVELSTEDVKLTLPSLRDFIHDYNAAMNPDYAVASKKAQIQGRLLLFGGTTNSPFVNNPENKSNPIFGTEVEVFEANNLPRHSIYLQVGHRLSSDDFEYSNTQIGLGYRFRFINNQRFNLYANIMAATYSFTKQTVEVVEDDLITEREVNNDVFDAPFIFGVGADFKISENGFITLSYDELFALALENQGNFSTHITIGYKLNL